MTNGKNSTHMWNQMSTLRHQWSLFVKAKAHAVIVQYHVEPHVGIVWTIQSVSVIPQTKILGIAMLGGNVVIGTSLGRRRQM